MLVHRASVVYNVPRTTQRDRVDGRIKIDTVKSGPVPLFSHEEEVRLVNHIKEMAECGYGYFRVEIISMAFDYSLFS
jgi:hypothetical protein